MAGREDVRTTGKKPRSGGGPDWHGGARLAARRGCFWWPARWEMGWTRRTATADGQWRCCRHSEMEAAAGRRNGAADVLALGCEEDGGDGESGSMRE
ncbi:glycosyltransferase [Sesbania bispinosa]|nr:glycosyltransferase [Sesbania bispinosa]